jgi:serine/threonine-protein kinase HipA
MSHQSGIVHSQLEQFGWHLLTNYVVRNADCHTKNIALYYTQLADVAYTPAYDIVTTQAYPQYATNPPGLSIEGRKPWAPGDRFLVANLPRHDPQAAAMQEGADADQVVSALQEVGLPSDEEERSRK